MHYSNKLAIVIPVYNINEALLRKCLSSLSEQKFQSVEYIIVDDGSTNLAGEICDEYAEHDGRMRVFHRENEGVSSARNFGLSQANSEYLAFVDADDYITSDFAEALTVEMDRADSDILFFHRYVTDENGNVKKHEKPVGESSADREDIRPIDIANAVISNNEASLGCMDVTFGSPWGKIFKTGFIKNNGLTFPVGIKKTQDRIFMLRCMAFKPRIHISDYYGYFYVENSKSVCQAYNPNIEKILDDAADEFLSTIHTYFSEEDQRELLLSYHYLKYDFMFTTVRLYYFNKKHKSTSSDYKKYIDLCKKNRIYIVKCKVDEMGKKKRLMLLLLKLHMYSILFCIMTYFLGMD